MRWRVWAVTRRVVCVVALAQRVSVAVRGQSRVIVRCGVWRALPVALGADKECGAAG